MTVIGVLGLQGAIREHVQAIQQIGATPVIVKEVYQLQEIDGLVLPGGESTTMRRLIDKYEFLEPLRSFAREGKPLFGTCAGMILLAGEIVGYEEPHIGAMDMHVERNSFGRQRESFEVNLDIDEIGTGFPAVFIRAPHILSVGKDVQVLGTHEGRIVAARQGNLLAVSFHPELTDDTRVIAYFKGMVEGAKIKNFV